LTIKGRKNLGFVEDWYEQGETFIRQIFLIKLCSI
jgi:hypothetical protein